MAGRIARLFTQKCSRRKCDQNDAVVSCVNIRFASSWTTGRWRSVKRAFFTTAEDTHILQRNTCQVGLWEINVQWCSIHSGRHDASNDRKILLISITKVYENTVLHEALIVKSYFFMVWGSGGEGRGCEERGTSWSLLRIHMPRARSKRSAETPLLLWFHSDEEYSCRRACYPQYFSILINDIKW